MKPSTREWIRKAEADYQLALALARRRKVTFHDHGCFLSQQSAEKYLKARLEEADMSFPKTHDLDKPKSVIGIFNAETQRRGGRRVTEQWRR